MTFSRLAFPTKAALIDIPPNDGFLADTCPIDHDRRHNRTVFCLPCEFRDMIYKHRYLPLRPDDAQQQTAPQIAAQNRDRILPTIGATHHCSCIIIVRTAFNLAGCLRYDHGLQFFRTCKQAHNDLCYVFPKLNNVSITKNLVRMWYFDGGKSLQ